MSEVIRLGLADDEPLLTAGLAMLLNAQTGMEVLWQAADGQEALERCRSHPVDVLLLDVQMPGLDGLETTRRLVEQGLPGRVVILTTFDTDGYVLGAIEAGAAGFLLKNTPPEQLVAAVRTVHRGDSVISPGPTRRLLSALRQGAAPWVAGGVGDAASGGTAGQAVAAASGAVAGSGPVLPGELTERELEVLRLVALGLTNQEVCDRLWLSMATVKTHVSHLLSKTGARDRVQLVLLALRSGVVILEEVLSSP